MTIAERGAAKALILARQPASGVPLSCRARGFTKGTPEAG